jgi:hypothetical protein
LVLENGRVAELDTPNTLLKNKKGKILLYLELIVIEKVFSKSFKHLRLVLFNGKGCRPSLTISFTFKNKNL